MCKKLYLWEKVARFSKVICLFVHYILLCLILVSFVIWNPFLHKEWPRLCKSKLFFIWHREKSIYFIYNFDIKLVKIWITPLLPLSYCLGHLFTSSVNIKQIIEIIVQIKNSYSVAAFIYYPFCWNLIYVFPCRYIGMNTTYMCNIKYKTILTISFFGMLQ